MSGKCCCCCKLVKPVTDFHRSVWHGGASPRCKECGISYAKAWYQRNKEAKRAYDEERRIAKRHLYRAASQRFRQSSPGRKNADTQLRRAAFAKRKPPWILGTELIVFYEAAARVSRCMKIKHHVDHIIPLRGEVVSGLHVPANLHVIPEILNLRKNNHFSIQHDGVK